MLWKLNCIHRIPGFSSIFKRRFYLFYSCLSLSRSLYLFFSVFVSLGLLFHWISFVRSFHAFHFICFDDIQFHFNHVRWVSIKCFSLLSLFGYFKISNDQMNAIDREKKTEEIYNDFTVSFCFYLDVHYSRNHFTALCVLHFIDFN